MRRLKTKRGLHGRNGGPPTSICVLVLVTSIDACALCWRWWVWCYIVVVQVKRALGAQCFPVGGYAIQTYLPDEEVGISAFLCHGQEKSWFVRVNETLCKVSADSSCDDGAMMIHICRFDRVHVDCYSGMFFGLVPQNKYQVQIRQKKTVYMRHKKVYTV